MLDFTEKGGVAVAVTRADVARLAGVSPAVVSYVLNPGSRPVSAAAKGRIEAAILELGYRPNAIAQALRRSSTMSIGLMVPDLANPVLATLIRLIEDIAYDLGYVLFVGTIGHDVERERRYLRTYVDRQVDALIVVGVHSSRFLAEAASQGLPIIVLDRIPAGLGLSSVVPEGRESAATAVRHLIEVHGHTRIGCIAGPANIEVAAERVDGWRAALEEAGLPADDSLLYRADAFTRESGHRGAVSLLESAAPTALFVVSEVQAVGVIGAIRQHNLLVPADVAIVTFDGSELATFAYPRLTTMDMHVDVIAELIMSRLVAKLGGTDPGETHDVLTPTLVIRRSCGCDEPGIPNPRE